MKTHIQIDGEVKKQLEKIRDDNDLVSLSAAVKMLIKKWGVKDDK